MPLVKVASRALLERFGLTEYQMGDDRIAICQVGSEIHAVDGLCPHRGGPLAQGALHGRMLVCPWHAWEFDCITGESDFLPAAKLKTYPVTVQGDDVLIEIE